MSVLLERLRRYRANRGIMANLRCLLVNSKKHRGWPACNRLGIDIKDSVWTIIAGLYATHPEETDTGNFGTTCKTIELKRKEQSKDEKLTPTERRFQHLLAAEPGQELYQRLTRMVLMAASQNIPINYCQLEKNIKYWNERTKADWAATFWTPNVQEIEDNTL